MATYKVPATGIPSGGFAVPDSFTIVDLSLQKQLVVVDAEAGTARLGSATGPIVAHWDDNVTRINGSIRGDRLIGDDDGATLVGGDGHDTLEDGGFSALGSKMYGGNGNDKFYLESATGSRADGGNGNDSFFVSDSTKKHVITGGNGVDTLVYRDADDDTHERVTVDLRTNTMSVDGVKVASVSGIERVYTESGKDLLYGDANNNRFVGGDGADRLHGYGGNDTLFGGEGNDFLNGGYGDDIMNGGAGNDYFAAGYDSDTFQFDQLNAGEVDTISIIGRTDTLDFRGAVSSLGELDIVIDDSDPSHKTATISIDVDSGVHTVVIEKLLSIHTLTDELAQHVLVG